MSGLRDAVDERFAVTGRDTPGWPAPRTPMAPPAEDEYSRVLDPGKYRILAARLQAWAEVLTERGLATVLDVDPGSFAAAHPDLPLGRAVGWSPLAAPGPQLLLGFRELDGTPDAVVDVGAGDPPRWSGRVPTCGCDACDDGSEALVDELDRALVRAVPWLAAADRTPR